MEFGKKKTINPLELSEDLPKQLYPTEKPKERDYLVLNQLGEVLKNRAETHSETSNASFTCYIERMAFDAFVRYANDIYKERGHEATGVIVGYYLHDKNNPQSTFIVGTNFLKATGPTTRVTCEFSYEDSIRHSNYCDEHKVLPLIWIHSHPGFGAFYSGTDDSTLKTYYYAPYQVGVVVDNLQKQILGYKMYGDNKQKENVYIFDLDKSNSNKLSLVYAKYILNKVKHTGVYQSKSNKETAAQEPNAKQKKIIEESQNKLGDVVRTSSTEKTSSINSHHVDSEKQEDKTQSGEKNEENSLLIDKPNTIDNDNQIPISEAGESMSDVKEASKNELLRKEEKRNEEFSQKKKLQTLTKEMIGITLILLVCFILFFLSINNQLHKYDERISGLEAFVQNLNNQHVFFEDGDNNPTVITDTTGKQ